MVQNKNYTGAILYHKFRKLNKLGFNHKNVYAIN